MRMPGLFAVLTLTLVAAAALAPAVVSAQEAAPASTDPRIKFKDGERYLRDLSETFEIPRDEICLELSRYDCSNKAFRITLSAL